MRICIAAIIAMLCASAQADTATAITISDGARKPDAVVEVARPIELTEAEAAAAASNLAASASLPATFPNGIAVPGPGDHWYEAVIEDGEIVPVQISNSPLDPATREAMRKEGREAHAAKRAAVVAQAIEAKGAATNIAAAAASANSVPALRAEVTRLSREVARLAALIEQGASR